MDEARIAELLAPFLGDLPGSPGQRGPAGASHAAALSFSQLRSISIYVDLLLRWNARMNLTAVRDPEEIVTRHFGESIFAARCLFPEPAVGKGSVPLDSGESADGPRVIDVGSGAGFPGLAIKIWAPQVRLTMIESNQKKATFLREMVRSLVLRGAEVFNGRAEVFPGPKGDVVTLRAVERFESILPVASGLVEATGNLAILIGESQLKVLTELLPVLRWAEPVRLPLSSKRLLILGKH